MKNLKLNEIWRLATFVVVLIFFSSSCKKDAAVVPDYVGTWVNIETDNSDSVPVSMKMNMTFTENTFQDIMQMQFTNGQWVNYLSLKGSMSLNGKMLNFTATEIGISSFNVVTGKPTGQMISYPSGSAEFDSFFNDPGQSKTSQSEYSVSGNQLTLKTDDNGNGNYLDSGEIVVYTKQ